MDAQRDLREVREARWRSWMVAAQRGDAVLYEKLLVELLPYVRGFVRRRLADAGVREDVVQNVFVAMHRARHTYRPERPFGPWLHAVARNAVIDHLRSSARRQGREISEPAAISAAPAPPEPAADDGLPRDLEDGLAALPDAQREAVWLIHVDGLSVAEAAERAGVSRSALKVRAHRGYRALRAFLEQRGARPLDTPMRRTPPEKA